MKTTFKEDFENELLRMNITLRELAEKTGINEQTIRNWKNGSFPKRDKFEKVASLLENLESYAEYESREREFDGKKLLKMMQKKGVSRDWLAKRIGVTRQSIDNYVKGRKPKYAIMDKLCDEFNVKSDFWKKEEDVFYPKERCDSKVVETQAKYKPMIERIRSYEDVKIKNSLEDRVEALEAKVAKLEVACEKKGFLKRIFG